VHRRIHLACGEYLLKTPEIRKSTPKGAMIRIPELLAHRPFDFTTGLGEPSEQSLIASSTQLIWCRQAPFCVTKPPFPCMQTCCAVLVQLCASKRCSTSLHRAKHMKTKRARSYPLGRVQRCLHNIDARSGQVLFMLFRVLSTFTETIPVGTASIWLLLVTDCH